MNCDQAEELLGAYALGALPPDEAAAFRAHIATCADHAAKAAELHAVAAVLPATVDAVPPPPALRSRILQAVAAEPAGGPLVATATPRSMAPAPSRGAGSRAPWRPAFRPAYAFGALAAALVLGLFAWNVVLMGRIDDREDDARYAVTKATAVATLQAHDAAGSGTVLYFADRGEAVIVADGLPQLGDGQDYQMWAITDGAPASVGLMEPDGAGHAVAVVPFDASSADIFAVTVEPTGGSAAPTGDPVYTAEL